MRHHVTKNKEFLSYVINLNPTTHNNATYQRSIQICVRFGKIKVMLVLTYGSKLGSYPPNMVVLGLHGFEGWRLHICVHIQT